MTIITLRVIIVISVSVIDEGVVKVFSQIINSIIIASGVIGVT